MSSNMTDSPTCFRCRNIELSMTGIILLLFVAAVSCTQFCSAQGNRRFHGGTDDGGNPLQLTQTTGRAPLNVRITGPSAFMEKVRKWDGRERIGGRGFGISWGDGQRQLRERNELGGNFNKENLFSHTYTVPGTYTVSVSTFTPGPTDAPIYDWMSSVTVTVSGDSEKKSSLQILAPQGGETFNYQDFPVVRWSLSTDQRVNLYLQLVTGDKVVAQEILRNIAYNEPRNERRFSPSEFTGYENALRSGKSKFRMVLQMTDENGKTILARSSREFTMTRRYVPISGGLRREQLGGDRLSVTLSYEVNHPSCFSYNLDWGDGTKDAEAKYDGNALLKITQKTFKHKYQKPGIYKVILRSNNLDPHKKLKDITPFESITFDLTK